MASKAGAEPKASILRENKLQKAGSAEGRPLKRVSVSSCGKGEGVNENTSARRPHSGSVSSYIDRSTGWVLFRGRRGGRGSGQTSGRSSTKGSWRDSYNGDSLDLPTDDLELEEPFSDSEDDEAAAARKRRGTRPLLRLPVPRRRIRTLSGTVPPVGYSPVWGGPTMCLCCMEFFELPTELAAYETHLRDEHKVVISEAELIVDLKRYVEHWRGRFKADKAAVEANEEGLRILSPRLPEDRKLRERLALRRLEEVLSCQQREREDFAFSRTCLFCRYRARGNRSKIIHHLYMIHHLNLGSPDNLVFVNEYLDLLKSKLDRNECLYCEKIFEDHTTLMEHMRKRQHREVNPKNSYYDRFYVINYLELGKKWLEVLAEDFEDTMPTFEDSEDEDETESWAEWLEDNNDEDATLVVCLFCDAAEATAAGLQKHCVAEHGFDLAGRLYGPESGLSFYDRMKVLNYIRSSGYKMACWVCGTEETGSWDALRKHLATNEHLAKAALPKRELWDKEEYLVPVFENDHLLWVLDSAYDVSGADEEAPDEEEEQKSASRLPASASDSKNGAAKAKEETETAEDGATAVVYAEEMPELESVLQSDPELLDQLR